MHKNQTIKSSLPVANTVATVTFPAVATGRWRLVAILASYSAAPTGGSLTVVGDQVPLPDGSNPAAKTVVDLDVIAGGPLAVPLPPQGIQMPDAGADMIVTLAAAGAAVVGSLTVVAELEQ